MTAGSSLDGAAASHSDRCTAVHCTLHGVRVWGVPCIGDFFDASKVGSVAVESFDAGFVLFLKGGDAGCEGRGWW